jgi:hypothetical protein
VSPTIFAHFRVFARGTQVEVVHRDQDAPLRGFQPVAHVRQGPAHDHAHRVREVRVLHLLFDEEVLDPVASFRRFLFLRQGRSFKMKVILPIGLTTMVRAAEKMLVCEYRIIGIRRLVVN